MSDTTTEPTAQVTTGEENSQPVESAESTAVEATPEAPTGETSNNKEVQPQDEAQPNDTLEWAKKKGLPLSEQPTEAELKLAQMQRDAERRMHEATNSQSELKKSLDDQVANADFGTDVNAQLIQEVTQLKINQQLSEFYASNPEAREYDADMAQLVTENPNLAGAGLEALYAYAKHRRGVDQADDIKRTGAKEALENVALKQEAASVAGNATTSATPSNKVTRELLQQKLREGDKEWIRKNQSAIDALTII